MIFRARYVSESDTRYLKLEEVVFIYLLFRDFNQCHVGTAAGTAVRAHQFTLCMTRLLVSFLVVLCLVLTLGDDATDSDDKKPGQTSSHNED